MDCDKADDAMMRYMDKTIAPAKAAALAKHLLKCEKCREYFLAFDEAAEAFAGTAELISTPEGFTEGVMAKVRKLPPLRLEKEQPTLKQPTVKQPAVNWADVGARAYWGLCAVLLGLTLGLSWYQDAAAAYVSAHPRLAAVVEFFTAAGYQLDRAWEQFLLAGGQMRAGTVSALSSTGYTTLLFVIIPALLLIVVQRGEKSEA